MSRKSVYEKLVRAARRGTGIRLTPEEVWELGEDTAISDAAAAAEERRAIEDRAAKLALKGKLFEPPKVRKPSGLCGGCNHPKSDHPNDSGCQEWH